MRHKWDFFIAHAGGDVRIAGTLYKLLFGHSRVFLDSISLTLGDNWNQILPDAQRQSLITIVIVSSRTEYAYYEKEEIAAAIQMARNNELEHRVIPIFFPGYDKERVPYGLMSKHSLVLNDETEIDIAAEKLLDTLQKTRKKRRNIKKSTSVSLSVSLKNALQTLYRAKEILISQLIVFNRARITPQDCDKSVKELLKIKDASNQFLINNASKSVVSQIVLLYKYEEDILNIISFIHQFRKISVQSDSEEIKQQIILGAQNLIKDNDSLVLKIKG